MVPAPRGASTNPIVETIPLRLGTTRNPHWRYKKDKRDRAKEKNEEEDINTDQTKHNLQDLLQMENQKERSTKKKVHWWLQKRPPPATTSVIGAAEDTLTILGGEELVGNDGFYRNRFDFVRQVIKFQKEKIKLRKIRRADIVKQKHQKLLKQMKSKH